VSLVDLRDDKTKNIACESRAILLHFVSGLLLATSIPRGCPALLLLADVTNCSLVSLHSFLHDACHKWDIQLYVRVISRW